MLAVTAGIGIVFVLGVLIRLIMDSYHDPVETGFITFLALMGAATFSSVATVTTYGIALDRSSFTQDLQALSDNTGVHGNFFLGSGTLDSVPAYYYYERRDDGSFYQWYVYAGNASIVETSDTPHVVRTCQNNNSFGHWVIWPLPMSNYDYTCSPDDPAVFYVPEGSVTNSFNLDLEN